MPVPFLNNTLFAGLVAAGLGGTILLGSGQAGIYQFDAFALQSDGSETSASWTMTAELRDLPRHNDVAAIRFDQTGHHLHQGGFARPIAPDQSDPVARLHHQIKIREHRIAPKREGNAGHL